MASIFLRSPKVASRVFGWNAPGQIVKSSPRAKFLFYTEFVLSDSGKAMLPAGADLNSYQGNRGLSFKVKQIDKPKINLSATELNQYNKKKIIYTKADYSDCTIRLYDSNDDSVLSFWVDYFTFYFADSRPKTTLSMNQSPVNGTFQDQTGWGFRPLTNDTNFFNKISVYSLFAGTYTKFSYINPKIVSIDWQNKDYASNDPDEVSINFKYELIEYERFGVPISSERMDQFGWSPIDALSTNANIPARPVISQPRIFSTSTTATTSSAVIPNNNIQTTNSNSSASVAPGATVPETITASGRLPSGTMNFA